MPSPLSQEQLEHFRSVLQSEQQSLIEEQDRLMDEVRAYTQGSEQRDDYGEDNADRGTDMFEREKNITLVETLGARLEQVRHALRRIDEGTYGLCEVCGQPINPERLDALPSATTCIKDAEKARSGR